jgi:hypothetical protein
MYDELRKMRDKLADLLRTIALSNHGMDGVTYRSVCDLVEAAWGPDARNSFARRIDGTDGIFYVDAKTIEDYGRWVDSLPI